MKNKKFNFLLNADLNIFIIILYQFIILILNLIEFDFILFLNICFDFKITFFFY